MPKRNGEITLAVLSTKLDNVISILQEHRAEFSEHVKKDEAIAIVVDRLSQTDQNRTWHFRALWTAVVAGAVAFFSNLVRTQ